MKYDYLIVGAGLAGTAFARIMADHGFRCLVLDRRNHTARKSKALMSTNMVHIYSIQTCQRYGSL